MNQTYRIFTDGSAIGNPGPGGWGAVVMQGKARWEMSGAFPWTTISEMELVAAVEALRPLPDRARVELHSDSEYLIYGMRVFVFHWQRQGWRNRRGNQLQHRELWSELIGLNARLHIRWTWIKGHNGNREQTPRRCAGVSGRSHSLGATEGRGLMPARIDTFAEGETLWLQLQKRSSLFEIDMELDGLLEEIQGKSSPKVRLRKTWLPVSSNSAKRTARRSTGSAASCA